MTGATVFDTVVATGATGAPTGTEPVGTGAGTLDGAGVPGTVVEPGFGAGVGLTEVGVTEAIAWATVLVAGARPLGVETARLGDGADVEGLAAGAGAAGGDAEEEPLGDDALGTGAAAPVDEAGEGDAGARAGDAGTGAGDDGTGAGDDGAGAGDDGADAEAGAELAAVLVAVAAAPVTAVVAAEAAPVATETAEDVAIETGDGGLRANASVAPSEPAPRAKRLTAIAKTSLGGALRILGHIYPYSGNQTQT